MSDRLIDSLVEATIADGIEPILKRLEKDLGRGLSTEVVVILDGIPGPRILISQDEEGSQGAPDGEVRVRMRRASGQHRYVYSAEAVYRRDLSNTGFSGFAAKGEVRLVGDALQVRPKSWTVRYQVWDFSKQEP